MRQLKQNIIIKLKIIITLFVIVLFITACQKESNENYEPSLNGKWQWTKTYGGFAGQTYTPQSTGETRVLEFKNDSICREYINGVIIFETTYTLKNIEGYHENFIFYKTGMIASIIIKLDRTNLVLSDYADDGFENTYIRKKIGTQTWENYWNW